MRVYKRAVFNTDVTVVRELTVDAISLITNEQEPQFIFSN